MNTLLTFDQVLAQTNKPHLLLGNGFSISYDKKRFSFTTLLNSALNEGIIDKNSELYKIFQKLETADFESVMRILEESEKVVEVYDGNKKLQKKLRADGKSLKEYLVKIITNNHPEKSTSLSSHEKESCISFLKNFNRIYTLNYDLLLYWASMQDQSPILADGFGNDEDSRDEGYVVYKNSSTYPMNIYYLHGALHYFDAESQIIKKTYVNTDIPLVKQVRASLDEGKYPIFISEGSSEQKMTKIMHSAYLNHCYKSLKSIGGKKAGRDIVIFGTYLKSNDDHMLDAILNSKVGNIYIGVSDIEAVAHVEARVDKYNSENKYGKSVILYDYKTVDVWGRGVNK